MGCNLLINGVYWGHYQLTNHLLTSWDFQADPIFWRAQIPPKQKTDDSMNHQSQISQDAHIIPKDQARPVFLGGDTPVVSKGMDR